MTYTLLGLTNIVVFNDHVATTTILRPLSDALSTRTQLGPYSTSIPTKTPWLEIASSEGNKETAGHDHPTIKPVELMRGPILWHSTPGGLIYEPFSGSGTALIAAEMSGRSCYAMELSPVYVDLALARWEAFTEAQAVRCG